MLNKKTIFISYGRDMRHPEHVALVEKIKKHLEKEFIVLMDLDRLQAGDDWELRLEQDILCSDWILFFITPYSARRPDGYCLNELSFSLSKRKHIAPIMIKYEVPPLSICRIQYLDFQKWQDEDIFNKKVQEIISVINEEKELNFEGDNTSLLSQLDPMKSEYIIAKHIYGFVGREWIFDQVSSWLKSENNSRVLWITAEAGYGKSALATYLSEYHPAAISIHFCQHDNRESMDPIHLLRVLIYELSTQVTEYHEILLGINIKEKLQGSPAYAFNELLVEPLMQISEAREKQFFIIDALDEARNSDGSNRITELISNRFSDLPSWLNIIITSRAEPELLRKLKKFNTIELKADEDKNHKDLKRYITHNIKDIEARKVELLLEKSEGNILYLKNIMQFEGVKEGNFSYEDIINLPLGMEAFYQQSFERRFNNIKDYERDLLGFVNIMVASKEGLPVGLIQYILDINERGYKKIQNKFGSLIEINNEIVTFYHKSLFDWLKDYDASGDYSADIDEGNKLLVSKLWKIYIADNIEKYPYYRTYLLQAVFDLKLYEYEKLETLLIDILFVGQIYNHEKQNLYRDILSQTIKMHIGNMDVDTLNIYDSFFRENEHLIMNSIHSNKETWKPNQSFSQLSYNEHLIMNSISLNKETWEPNQTIFQLAYEDGDNSPLSRYCDALISNNKIHFHYLRNLNRPPLFDRTGLYKVLIGHTDNILGIEILSNNTILSYAEDDTLRIWSIEGDPLYVMEGHTDIILGIKILDNKKILSYSKDATLRLWNFLGEELAIMERHSPLTMQGFIDGKGRIPNKTELNVKVLDDNKLLSYANDGLLCLWDFNGKLITSLKTELNSFNDVYINNYNEIILTGNTDSKKQVFIQKKEDKEIQRIISEDKLLAYYSKTELALYLKDSMVPREKELTSNISKDAVYLGNNLVIYGSENKFSLISIYGKIISELKGYQGHISSFYMLQDKYIVAFSDNYTLYFWSHKGVLLFTAAGHTDSIISIKILNDGNILSYSEDFTLRLWSPSGKSLAVLAGHSNRINGIEILDNGNILSYSEDFTLRLWSPSGKSLAVLVGHTEYIQGVKIFNNRILSYSEDYTLKIWDFSGQLLTTIDEHKKSFEQDLEQYNYYPYPGIGGVEVLNNNKFLSFSGDGEMLIWNMDGKKISTLSGHESGVIRVIELKNEKILSYSWDHTFRLWNLTDETSEIVAYCKPTHEYHSAFNDKYNYLITSQAGQIFVSDMKGNFFYSLTSPTTNSSFRILDLNLVVTYSDDGTIIFWNEKFSLLSKFRLLKDKIKIIAVNNDMLSVIDKGELIFYQLIKNSTTMH